MSGIFEPTQEMSELIGKISEPFIDGLGKRFTNWSWDYVTVKYYISDLELIFCLSWRTASWGLRYVKIKPTGLKQKYGIDAAMEIEMSVYGELHFDFQGSLADPDSLSMISKAIEEALSQSDRRRTYLGSLNSEAADPTRSQPTEGHPQDGPADGCDA